MTLRFINNEFVEGVDKKKFEVINPSNEEVITSVCEATEKDVDIAVAAARKAFEGEWRQVTPNARASLLMKLADIVEKNIGLLAAVESLDNGKSITMAHGDVGAVIGCLRYYGGWADKIEGKTIDIAPDMFHFTRPEPVSFPHYCTKDVEREAILTCPIAWRLRSNHPLELPSPHAGLEDWACAGYRKHRHHEVG